MLTFSRLGHYGRFANSLFQIAGTIGLAIKNGYSYGFPQWVNHDHARLGYPDDIQVQKYFVNPLPQLSTTSYPDFPIPWGWYPDLKIPDNVSLSGHLQSEKYFAHCIDTIRHYFTMKEEYPQNGDVAVHVRLGDYDDKYHTRLKRDYYEKAMVQFGPDTSFKVFSDDPEKAEEMLQGLGYIHVYRGANYLDDFKMMKSSKHFITGNSSFSLMAAILGTHPDKTIICPSHWFGPAWCPETKDLYPEKAIII